MTQQLSTTSIISLFDTTKSQRESFCLDLIDRIESGTVEPLKIHFQVKCMENLIKMINENTRYKSAILEASQKMGQKSFDWGNSKFEIKEVGVKYDFSKCEDPVLNDLMTKKAQLDEEVKVRQDMLKTVPAKGIQIMVDGGELVTVYPPAKSSTTSVAVTLK